MAEIDHLVIACASLEQGAEWAERALGVAPMPGGAHPGVGTHNALLGMGAVYLELIAPDPAQPDPPRPRPFGLDDPAIKAAVAGTPRLVAYVGRSTGLDALSIRLGDRAGEMRAMTRGSLRWRLLFPPQGTGLGALVPPMIEWEGRTAAEMLPDSGLRLLALEAEHPDIAALQAGLSERGLSQAVAAREGAAPRLLARIARTDGGVLALASG
ncbi:VOC family protein [Acetobacteraceae bacterium H6797]|nr:VOC family protein [Acetobacteraceae bacterium H6797]